MKRKEAVAAAGTLIAGVAIGAGVMYLLSPAKSRPRIALLPDKIVDTIRILERSTGIVKRDLLCWL